MQIKEILKKYTEVIKPYDYKVINEELDKIKVDINKDNEDFIKLENYLLDVNRDYSDSLEKREALEKELNRYKSHWLVKLLKL